jgi:hypothetical protein
VPAALCFSEALRAMRQERRGRFFVMTALLALLKLRFVTIALPLLLLFFRRASLRLRYVVIAALAIVVPIAVMWLISGNPLSVHDPAELHVASPHLYLVGFFGLLLDGQHGLLFAAPLLFLGLLALFRREPLPAALKLGALAALPYLILLFPRGQWHGGWSPPLRYLVVFAPLFALLLARGVERHIHPALLSLAGCSTAMLAVHALSQPWRLFHLENGEATFGETLSRMYASDFSRLVPSYVRLNIAAYVAVLLLVGWIAFVTLRKREAIGAWSGFVLSLLLLLFFRDGLRAGKTIELEDAHVVHRGGELFPHEWEVARFNYDGAWRVSAGTELTFRARPGNAALRYTADAPAVIEIDGTRVALPPAAKHVAVPIALRPRAGRSELKGESGTATLDRIDHE